MTSRITREGTHYILEIDGRPILRTKSKDEALRMKTISDMKGWDTPLVEFLRDRQAKYRRAK